MIKTIEVDGWLEQYVLMAGAGVWVLVVRARIE